MRKIDLCRAKPGYYTARTIQTLDGIILLPAGTKLTDESINHLKRYHITAIYIEDDLSRGITVTDTIKEELISDVKHKIKTMMLSYTFEHFVDGKKIIKMVEMLLCEILKNDFMIINLSDIRSTDDYTYSHSVNVAILSLITGIKLGFRGSSLKDIGVGAMLHDIGKVMVNNSILKKPTNLTMNEYEEVKRHTVYGYEILKESKDVPQIACIIALYHHERNDGSGYPYNLKNNEIPLQARIVAIADVYDALTTDRIYRQKMRPHEVVDYMCSLSSRCFDNTVLNALIGNIANYPTGTGVKLNTGEKGLVAKYNKNFPNKPIIRVVIDENGEKLNKPKEINMLRQAEYKIIDIWDI